VRRARLSGGLGVGSSAGVGEAAANTISAASLFRQPASLLSKGLTAGRLCRQMRSDARHCNASVKSAEPLTSAVVFPLMRLSFVGEERVRARVIVYTGTVPCYYGTAEKHIRC
jgi:hypothetical protein